VLLTTRGAVETAGVANQFQLQSGDMFTAELPPQAFDLILLGNVCHLFSAQYNRTLLRRLRPALRPGGVLAIIDAVPSNDPDQARQLTLYALGLRLRTTAGAVYRSTPTPTGHGKPATGSRR